MPHPIRILQLDRHPSPVPSAPSAGAAAVLATLAEGICGAVGADGSMVARMDGAHFVVDAAAGTLKDLLGGRHLAGETLPALALRDRRSLACNTGRHDARLDPHFAARYDVRQIVVAPFSADERTRGVVVAINSQRGAFTDTDRAALEHFATLAALACGATSTPSSLQERNERLAAVACAEDLLSHASLQDVATEALRTVAGAIPSVHRAALLLLNTQRGTLRPIAVTADSRYVPLSNCADLTISPEAARALQSLSPIRHLALSLAVPALVTTTPLHEPIMAELLAPLVHGSGSVGLLVLHSYHPDAFSVDDVDVATLIARRTSAAIENARLLESRQRERELAEAAATIARAALAVSTLPATSADILAAIQQVVPCDGLALAVSAIDEKNVTYVAATGTLAALQNVCAPRDRSTVSLVAGEDAPIRTTDVERARICEGEALGPDGIIVPLLARNRVIGVVLARFAPTQGSPDAVGQALARLAAPVALAVDVMVLGEADRRRRDRERMLATALATMEQPVFVLGLDRRILYANAAAGREYGYTLEEFMTLSLDSLVDSAVPARRITASGAEGAGSVWTAEHVHRRKDGSVFPTAVVLNYIRDDAGTPVGQVLNIRSLEEERRLEEQLRQSEKLAAIGELVAGVAHELNNPLTGISAFAQLLLDEPLTDDQVESVRLIKRESDRAVAVIRDLLLFSRKTGPSREPVNLHEVVDLTLRLRAYSLRTAGVTVSTYFDEDAPRVYGDPLKLQQVLINLVVNAEYALQQSSVKRLTLLTRSERNGVSVVVSDTGSGMSPETRQRIFEPFFTTKPAGQGTGLGLSVSYGIIRSHGGTIEVDSAPGRGTTFTIFLPSSAELPLQLGTHVG